MRNAFDDDGELISRINVTPLVDVVLVLLVVLMITATAVLSQIPVQTPSAGNSTGAPTLTVSIAPNGTLRVDGQAATKRELRLRLRQTRPDRAIVSAHDTVDHASVVALMDLLRRGGVENIALQTEVAPR